MRAGKTIGVALAVLVAGALGTIWQSPGVAAEGRQTGSQNQQAEGPKVMKVAETQLSPVDKLLAQINRVNKRT